MADVTAAVRRAIAETGVLKDYVVGTTRIEATFDDVLARTRVVLDGKKQARYTLVPATEDGSYRYADVPATLEECRAVVNGLIDSGLTPKCGLDELGWYVLLNGSRLRPQP